MQYKHLKLTNQILFFAFAALAALYYGTGILIPVTFAAFLAALVVPLCNLLEKLKLGRIPAALLSTIGVFIIVGGVSYLLVYQLSIFANDLPLISTALTDFLHNLQEQFSSATGISKKEQQQFLHQHTGNFIGRLENQLTVFLGNLLFVVLKFLLVLIYLFLFLLYRKRFKKVVLAYWAEGKKTQAQKIMDQSTKVIHHYLWGRVKVMSILAIMYLLTFWFFDVKYMILLTVFGTIITIIPYLGPLISGVLPVMIYILFSNNFASVLLFSSVVLVVQLIESYVLEPIIIGSEVKLNPLAVIVAVIIGGTIWGLAGMILFVPLLAMIKIFADHDPVLRPLGFVLGNTNIDSK